MNKKDELLTYLRIHRTHFDPDLLQDMLKAYIKEAYPEGIYETKMGVGKLCRAENIHPIDDHTILFEIERHGAAAMGSIYVGVQIWEIDIAADIARQSVGRKVQIKLAAPAFTKARALELAQHVFGRIESGDRGDCRIRFLTDGRVAVVISECVLDKSPKQTLQGRRRRFQEALNNAASERGWKVADKPYGRLPTFIKDDGKDGYPR